LLGIAASASTFLVLHNGEETRIDYEFKRRAQSIANLMADALRNREEALLTMRELFHYSTEVTRNEFERASSDLIARHPGLQSLKWAPRVPSALREKYEESAHSDGYSDFKISQTASSGQRSEVENAPDAFPIFYDAPATPSQKILGLDLTTSLVWPEFQQAAREGNLRASGRMSQITNDSSGGSYLIELPVYVDSVPPTEQERIKQLRGFVLGVFKPSALLEKLVTQIPRTGLDVLLAERVSGNDVYTLYYRPAEEYKVASNPTAITDIARAQHHHIDLPFAGRNWEMWFRPSPEWLSSQRTAHEFIVAAFGLLITILTANYLRVLFRQTIAVESLVAQRTAELTATQRELRDDIQRRTLTEQALKASEARYRTLVSQSSDAIWRLELPQPIPVSLSLDEQIERIVSTGVIAECNNLTAQMYGRKQTGEILGQKFSLLSPSSLHRHESLLRAFVRSGYSLAEHESSDTSRGGETRTFVHNLIGVLEHERLARIWVTERELTHQRLIEQEKQAFERRLGETQRLESLGVLAGGIAHDFNNLLTGIMGHASLGRSVLDTDAPLNMHFVEIENASRSAANLCQQMLAYAGKGRFVVKSYDLSQIVSQTAHLLHVSVTKQAELRFQLSDSLPPIIADATQIQQIVMNLVINASESIGQGTGLITLTTDLIQADTTTFVGCPYAPEKPVASYVYLEVRDNGCGMSADVINRIFEPFFTTKFAGRGLGLAAALGIVRSHAGALRVESKPGEGTSFTLFLPCAEEPAKSEDKNYATNSPWAAEGTLLVIDDEAPVRSVAEHMAQSLGFSALNAVDGAQGLELFQLYKQSISVVLLDLSMPGLAGEEMVERLRALSRSVRIVVMSGYNHPSFPTWDNKRPLTFLAKPFTIAQFQSAVRQAIKHG
jgi:signal transduction histidine kinase/CheY-like chemotaxis protein